MRFSNSDSSIVRRSLKRLAAAVAAASLFAALAIACVTPAHATPEAPGEAQKQPIALVGGTIHPVSGPSIVEGVVLIEKGRITAIGKDVPLPAGTQKFDVKGKHIFPSLIDAHSNMGLVEINSVKATVDDSETGSINPNVRAIVAVNPDSEIIPTTRSNGVLLTLTAPSGGILAGRSAVIQLDGWTWEDLTLRDNVALHLNWPNMSPTGEWLGGAPGGEQASARDRALDELKRAFEQARAYAKARRAPGSRQSIDVRWESMLDVLDGKIPVMIHADEIHQIQAAVAFGVDNKLKMMLHGGYDAPRCAALLKQHNVPVIVAGTYRLPMRKSDDFDASYTVPERLRAAGIKYCIASAGRFGASNVRNLPYQAATAAAYGLPVDEALKSVTLYPAEILGIADRVGSLEVGKDATLFIADGHPLETETLVEAAFVQGRKVELNDRHKRLWKKYEEKQRQLAK